MLTGNFTREQRIANLVLHGWEPVEDNLADHRRYLGLMNAGLGVGYVQCRSAAGRHVICLEADPHPWMVPQPCSWDKLNADILDALALEMQRGP